LEKEKTAREPEREFPLEFPDGARSKPDRLVITGGTMGPQLDMLHSLEDLPTHWDRDLNP